MILIKNKKSVAKDRVLLFVLCYLLLFVLQFGSFALMEFLNLNPTSNNKTNTNDYLSNFTLLIIAIIFSPIFEEWFFRKHLFRLIQEKLVLPLFNEIFEEIDENKSVKRFVKDYLVSNWLLSACLSSIFFALCHFTFTLLPFFCTGLVFCYHYFKSHSILLNILLHSLFNLSVFVLTIMF